MFSYSTLTNSAGESIILLRDQVSGTALPNLIFNMLDESGELIDSTYLKTVSTSVLLTVTKNTTLSSGFFISSSTTEYSFEGYFNLTGLIITATPGKTISLQLTSTSIEATSSVTYRLILQIEFRACTRGEIFKSVTSGSLTYY